MNPDGMLISKDGKQLIVVNNAGGANGNVMSFSSGDEWQSGYVKETYQTGPVFPTTATSDGKGVYTLYAYLNILFSGGTQHVFTIQELPFKKAQGF